MFSFLNYFSHNVLYNTLRKRYYLNPCLNEILLGSFHSESCKQSLWWSGRTYEACSDYSLPKHK